jgi:hypothetical protein
VKNGNRLLGFSALLEGETVRGVDQRLCGARVRIGRRGISVSSLIDASGVTNGGTAWSDDSSATRLSIGIPSNR